MLVLSKINILLTQFSPGIQLVKCRNISKLSRREYLYGISPCFAALKAGQRKIFKIYLNKKFEKVMPEREHLNEIVKDATLENISILYKSSSILDKLTMNRTHQNIVMEVGKLSYKKLETDLQPSNEKQFWLALDQIHDPMNLGAILRTCAYFGVDRVIVSEQNCCPLTAAVCKASSGAMEWVPMYSVSNLKKFLKRSRTSGWDVIGSMSRESDIQCSISSCDSIGINKPTILVVGNEGSGLDKDIVKLCTKSVTVESYNPSVPIGLDSLNVSVATGVMLHSLLKDQREERIKMALY